MSTLIDRLNDNEQPEYIKKIAQHENIDVDQFIQLVCEGKIVIPMNNAIPKPDPIAIGEKTRIKINANMGTSPNRCDADYEIEKVKVAIKYGADTIMDLSIAGNVSELRQKIIELYPIPIGTVPIYEAMIGLTSPDQLSIGQFLNVIEKQAKEGVDFMTIHAGLLKQQIPDIDKRLLGVVSRGGSLIVKWMRYHQKQNFTYEYFDDILAIAKEYDITMSLGDGLRPGCTADSNDAAQLGELNVLGELVQRCREQNVQVMVEGPGHVPLHLIQENITLQKTICHQAPFYVLGPLVLDYATGYDHIAGAIGGALAAYHGADFLCYVTPAEHLRLPTIDDVRDGVIASKIAAVAVDLSRNNPRELERNRSMSLARKQFDWESQKSMAIDTEKFTQYFEKGNTSDVPPCTMCGDWCAMKHKQG